jgi:hypothetical protein
MVLQPHERVVKQGTFRYDGEVTCDLRIVYSPVRYGSGDYEDPPECADDRDIDSFYVQYGSTTERGVFKAGTGAFASLTEAVAHAEDSVQDLTWLD